MGKKVTPFDKTVIAKIRRVIPGLISNEIAGIQPMTGPAGLIFSLKSKYGSVTRLSARTVSTYDGWLAQNGLADDSLSVGIYIEELLE